MFGKSRKFSKPSTEKKQEVITELNPESVTKQQLQSISYGKLKETFEALGIPEVWKPGSKKDKLIDNAIQALSISNKLKAQGYSDEEIDAKIKQQEEDDKALQAQLKLEQKQKEELAKQKAEQYDGSVKLSKQKIEETIVKIQSRLNSNKLIPTHRKNYLDKLAQFENMLKDGHYVEGKDEFDLAQEKRNAQALLEAKRQKASRQDEIDRKREERLQSYKARQEARQSKIDSSK